MNSIGIATDGLACLRASTAIATDGLICVAEEVEYGSLTAVLRPRLALIPGTIVGTTQTLVGILRATGALISDLRPQSHLVSSLGIGAVEDTGVDDDMIIGIPFTVPSDGDEFTVPIPPGSVGSGNYTITIGVGTVITDYGLPKMPHADRTSTSFKVYFSGIVDAGTTIDFHLKEIV